MAEREIAEPKDDLRERFYLSVRVYSHKLGDVSEIQALLRQRNFMAGHHYTLIESFNGPFEPDLLDVMPGRGQDRIMIHTERAIIQYLKKEGLIDR